MLNPIQSPKFECDLGKLFHTVFLFFISVFFSHILQSATFGNPPLIDNLEFEIQKLELWSIDY